MHRYRKVVTINVWFSMENLKLSGFNSIMWTKYCLCLVRRTYVYQEKSNVLKSKKEKNKNTVLWVTTIHISHRIESF
jgi:hypothetical protein